MKPHACDSSRGARGVVGMRALRATAYALLLLAPLLAPQRAHAQSGVVPSPSATQVPAVAPTPAAEDAQLRQQQRERDRAGERAADLGTVEAVRHPVDATIRCSFVLLARYVLDAQDQAEFKTGLGVYDEVFGRMATIISAVRYVQARAALPPDRELRDALAQDVLAEQIPSAIACTNQRTCAAWAVGTTIGAGINQLWRMLEAARLATAGQSGATARTARQALTDFYYELFNSEEYTHSWQDAQGQRHLNVQAMQRLLERHQQLSSRISSELAQQEQQYQRCTADDTRRRAQGASQDIVGDLLRRQNELMQRSADGLDAERARARQAGQSIFDRPVPTPTPMPLPLPSAVGGPGPGGGGGAANRPGCTYDQTVAQLGQTQQCQSSCTARISVCGALVPPGAQERCRAAQQALDSCLQSCRRVQTVCR